MKTILIVDDEPQLVLTLGMRLKAYGYNVETAANGQECLDKIQNSSNLDLILLDLMMPVMSGYEVMEKLKENPKPLAIPIIIFSAANPADIKKRVSMKEVSGYISKPYDPKELLAVIEKTIKTEDE